MVQAKELPQAKSREPRLGDFLFSWFMQQVFEITLNLFFSHMEILGAENIPAFGPMIVVGNHNNQFADGILLSNKCWTLGKWVRFIIAEKSWHRPIIGDLAKAIKSIPVARPQDSAKKGVGKVSGKEGGNTISGEGTSFTTAFKVGDSIRAGGGVYRVTEIPSDDELRVREPLSESLASVDFKIFPQMDQNQMYRHVYDLFREGGTLGIFPEGGSHDRTEMLPLKAGVCIMALSTMQQYPDLNVKIVPCGLNYIAGHKFRSRVIINFGPPIEIPKSMVELYQTDKRKAIGDLLEEITQAMKDVVVQLPDYDALTTVNTIRRLYCPVGRRLSSQEYHYLQKRISLIYDGKMKEADHSDFDELVKEIKEYRQELYDNNIRDSQVARMQEATLAGRKRNSAYLLIERVLILLAMAVVTFPGLLLVLPVNIVGERVAAQKAKEALAGSDVKIKAYVVLHALPHTGRHWLVNKDMMLDVIASWKLIVILIMVPTMITTYSSIFAMYLYFTTEWSGWQIFFSTILFALFLPWYGKTCVTMYDDIVRGLRTVKPLYLRATGAIQSRGEQLVILRTSLQTKVRDMIEKDGPKYLGEGFQDERIIKPADFVREAELKRLATTGRAAVSATDE